MIKSSRMQQIEQKHGKRLEEIIKESLEAGMTQEQLAADLDVSFPTLRQWLMRMGAQRKVVVTFGKEKESAGVG